MVDMASRGSTSRYLRIPRRCTCRRSRLEDMACCAQCPKCQKGQVFHPACEAPAHSDSETHRGAEDASRRILQPLRVKGGWQGPQKGISHQKAQEPQKIFANF